MYVQFMFMYINLTPEKIRQIMILKAASSESFSNQSQASSKYGQQDLKINILSCLRFSALHKTFIVL